MARNLTPVVHAIKSSGADIVAITLARSVLYGNLAAELRAAQVAVPLIGGTGLSAKAAFAQAGPALSDSYSMNQFAVDATPGSRTFAQKYRDRTGSEADQHSAMAYDAVQLLALAIGKAGSTQPNAIRNSLHAIRGHEGAAGAYTFDASGDSMHGLYVLKNDRGKLTIAQRLSFSSK
jgi:branched-chain amino acid transport system substrate-binding protein